MGGCRNWQPSGFEESVGEIPYAFESRLAHRVVKAVVLDNFIAYGRAKTVKPCTIDAARSQHGVGSNGSASHPDSVLRLQDCYGFRCR